MSTVVGVDDDDDDELDDVDVWPHTLKNADNYFRTRIGNFFLRSFVRSLASIRLKQYAMKFVYQIE